MEREEAIKQIEMIQSAIRAGNRLVFSNKKGTIAKGALICGLSVVMFVSPFLTQWFGDNSKIVERGLFLLLIGLVIACKRLWKNAKELQDRQSHPLILKAVNLTRSSFAVLLGVYIIFPAIGANQLMLPITLIMIGTLYNLYGGFASPAIRYISWSYFAAGLLQAFLTKFSIPQLDTYFVFYLGASLILMGLTTRADREPL